MQLVEELFVHNAFVLEFILSIWLFCHYFKRKKAFLLRAIAVSAVLILNSILWNAVKALHADNGWMLVADNILKYLLDFVLGYFGILFCTESKIPSALFSMICAVATQHLSYRIYASILALAGLDFNSYASALIIAVVVIVVYISVYYMFVRRLKRQPEQRFENKLNILVGGVVVLSAIVLHFFIEYYVSIRQQPFLYLLISGYDIICCLFILMLEHGLLRNKVLASDKEFLEHLVHKQEEQYRTSKANLDIINIKCHDMKHQISKMTSTADPEAIKELEQIISIYDSSLQTGNEILDVCLMEKKLLCERSEIKFDCIANGECLAFMQAADIFSIFGNAMDNAMEAVCKIEDIEKRIISLNIKERLGMVIIHIENNFMGDLLLMDGLPKTNHKDTDYHGFGVKSMQMVTEKYNGNMAVLASDGVFNLNIVIPIPKDNVKQQK